MKSCWKWIFSLLFAFKCKTFECHFSCDFFLPFSLVLFFTISSTSHAVEGISFPLVMARINSTSDFSRLCFVERKNLFKSFNCWLVCERKKSFLFSMEDTWRVMTFYEVFSSFLILHSCCVKIPFLIFKN